MTKLDKINKFLESKEIIFAGVPRDEKKFGYKLFEALKKKGYTIYPTNPHINKVNGTQCYQNIKNVPINASSLVMVTPKQAATEIVKEAIEKKVEMIWFQRGSFSGDAVSLAKENGLITITGECLFMFLHPVKGVHRFHKFLRKLFGSFPK